MNFQSGYISILGLPNVGKSTLMNQLINRNLSIVTAKPQTTRNRILGIRSDENFQMLFLDTPGWYQGKLKLDGFYRSEVLSAVGDADLALFLVDGRKPRLKQNQSFFQEILRHSKIPVLILISKIDLLKQSALIPLLDSMPKEFSGAAAYVPVSSNAGPNLETLEECILEKLPEGPQFFPEEQITDKSKPFLLAEFLREAYFEHLDEEIPFGIATVVEDYSESERSIQARVCVYVERPGQKQILVGAGGDLIHTIKAKTSMRARRFFGKKVTLDLWIKVKKNWRQNAMLLNQIGYKER